MKFPLIFSLTFLILRSSAEDRGAGDGAIINIAGVMSGATDAAAGAVGTLVLDDGPLGVMTRLMASSLRLIGVDTGVRSVNGGAPDEPSSTNTSETENVSRDNETTTSSSERILTE